MHFDTLQLTIMQLSASQLNDVLIALSHSEGRKTQQALKVCINLSSKPATRSQLVTGNGATCFSLICNLLNSDDQVIVMLALWALSNLVVDERGVDLSTRSSELLPKVFEIVKETENSDIRTKAICFLINLSLDKRQRTFMSTQVNLDLLIDLIYANLTSTNFVNEVWLVLKNLLCQGTPL